MDDEDGRWLSYDDLAAQRGTSRRAAVMLVRRHRWRRQKDNEGHTRALVPATWSEPVAGGSDSDRSGNSSGHDEGHGADYGDRALAMLEDALFEANKRADAAQVLAERTLAELADANARADRTAAAMAGERSRADALRDRLEAAKAELQQAQQTAEALRQADTARKTRGRLWCAWDGWRGR